MKKLNKKEMLTLARLLMNEIKYTEYRRSYESEMENYGQAEDAEKYIRILENIYKKI